MNLEQSVASMTVEQIAESFDIMARCNVGFIDKDNIITPRGHLAQDVARLISGRHTKLSKVEALEGLNAIAKEIEHFREWKGRYLVCQRAIAIVEDQ